MADPKDRNKQSQDDENFKQGTWSDPKNKSDKDDKKEEDKDKKVSDFTKKLGADKLTSPSDEELDEVKDQFFVKEETEKDKDGKDTDRKIKRQGITEADAEEAKKTIGDLPEYENLTHSLLGTPGIIDLTQGGMLNTDRSKRPDEDERKKLDEEVQKFAGPNPLPNREGNEKTKAELGIALNTMVAIDRGSKERIKKLADKITDKEQKTELEQIAQSIHG